MEPFLLSRTPVIRFGAGVFSQVPEIVATYGRTLLLVTGSGSFSHSLHYTRLIDILRALDISFHTLTVSGEPSPDLVDRAAKEFRKAGISAVLAVGGGSVIDAGKAISAMLPQNGSVFDYLEGVGTGKKHDGRKVPFIAAPTTAGTGSEATKNAVLSRTGPGGFKKSIRHDTFVPDHAVVDPELTLSCPAGITAACGMDAFTQLLESYVSVKASPVTDALARSGMERMKDSLVPSAGEGAGNLEIRSNVSYGALLSGITLANAGLGVVHGLASTIGGLFPIPHGVICGVLLEPATRVTIRRLREEGAVGLHALDKYADIGGLVSGAPITGRDRGCELLIERLSEWRRALRLPLLSEMGMTRNDIASVAAQAGNGNNPVKLDASDIREVLESVIR